MTNGTLTGAQVRRKLGEGAHSTVLEIEHDGHALALKVPKSADALLRTRREAALMSRAVSSAIPSVLGLVAHESSGVGIAMSLVAGRTLEAVITNASLSVAEIISGLRSLAQLVATLAQAGIVHRDINPTNVMVGDDGTLTLIDFGLATCPRFRSEQEHAALGTMLCSSPEQLGLVDAPLTLAADLYSVGAVAYRMATGRPPFEAATIELLLDQHLRSQLTPLKTVRADLPPLLDALIMRLLHKNASERPSPSEILDTLEMLAPGSKPVLPSAPPAIRGAELQRVLAFHKQRGAAGSLTQIIGPAGSGKSALAAELTKAASTNITIRFAENATDPLQALRRGVSELLDGLPKHECSAFLEQLTTRESGAFAALAPLYAAGSHHGVKSLEVLATESSHEVFTQEACDLLAELTQLRGGLTLFFDNVQWCDNTTKKVLQRLLWRLASLSLRIVTASRTVVSLELDRVPADAVHTETLEKLSHDQLLRLARDFFPLRPLSTALSDFIVTRADGTPLLTSEYLWALLESGSVFPGPVEWEFDQAALAPQLLGGDVVAILLSKLDDASPGTLEVLGTASGIGMTFSTRVLRAVCSVGPEALNTALEEAKRLQLIERAGDDVWSFLHDRVRHALSERLSPARAHEIHWGAAQAAFVTGAADAEVLLAARHVRLVGQPADASWARQALLAGARVALRQYGEQEALELINHALLLGGTAEQTADAEALELMGDCYFRLRSPNDAIARYERAANHHRSGVRRAEVWLKVSQSQFASLRIPEAARSIDLALREVGAVGPDGNPLLKALKLVLAPLVMCVAWVAARVRSLSDEERERQALITRLFDFSSVLMFYTLRPVSLSYVFIMSLPPAVRLRSPRFTLSALCNAGTFSALGSLRGLSRWFLAKAYRLATHIGAHEALGHFHVYAGMSAIFLSDDLEAERHLTAGLITHGKWLGIYDYLLGAGSLMSLHQSRGHCEAGLEFMRRCTENLDRSDPSIGRFFFWKNHIGAIIHAQLGNRAEVTRSVAQIDRNSVAGLYDKSFFWANEVNLRLETGELDEPSTSALEGYHGLRLSLPQVPAFYVSRVYTHHGSIIVRRMRRATGAERERWLKELKGVIRHAWGHAKLPHVRAHRRVLKAVVANEERRPAKARRLLARAEEHFRRTDNRIGLFDVWTERVRTALLEGEPEAARVDAMAAYDLAQRNRWRPRLDAVQSEFAVLGALASEQQPQPATSVTSSARDALFEKKLRAVHDLRVSIAQLVDPEAINVRMLEFTVDLLQAERALLFLLNEQGQLEFSRGLDQAHQPVIEATGYSTSSVNDCLARVQPLLLSGVGDQILKETSSVVAHGLKSIIVSPLSINDRCIGILYLDNRVVRGVFSNRDKAILLDLCHHMALSIEQAKLVRLEIANVEMKKDLELTGVIQRYLLPQENELTRPGFSMATFYRPMVDSGGDWWQWDEPEGRTLRVLMGDVVGHGAGPAMVTALLSGTYRSWRSRDRAESLQALFEHLHHVIRTTFSGQFWVSMSGFVWNAQSRQLEWATLGSPPLLLASKASGSIQVLQQAGTHAGQDHFSFSTASVHLPDPSRLLLITDGLFECEDAQRRRLGPRNIVKTVQASLSQPPSSAVQALFERGRTHVGDQGFDDDISIVTVDL